MRSCDGMKCRSANRQGRDPGKVFVWYLLSTKPYGKQEGSTLPPLASNENRWFSFYTTRLDCEGVDMRKRGVKKRSTAGARENRGWIWRTIGLRLAVLSMVLQIGFLLASADRTFSPQSKSGGLISSTLSFHKSGVRG